MLTASEAAHLDALLTAGPDSPDDDYCPDCDGRGRVVCGFCGGSAADEIDACPDCEYEGVVTCQTCGGSGIVLI